MTSDKKSIYKPRPISGFPEWLPEVRLVEQKWMDHIRHVYESYGYCNIETPSVEELDVLRAKGEVDKEIYVIERLHADESDKSESRLALHFDQTVPLARYVAQHFNNLVFPFKRYQMQRVWRGERPQAGRFREFYQCDIDVINVDNLPLYFDAEMPAIIWEIFAALPGMEHEKIQLQISNRKILLGLLADLGIEDATDVTRAIDKIEKIGNAAVEKILANDCNLDEDKIKIIINLVNETDLNKITARGAMMEEGLSELKFVMDQLRHLPEGAAIANLSIVRGLDYYTGTVYETRLLDDLSYGSICSGGRYDDLAGSYINKKLPGVGISIGLSRLFDRMQAQQKIPVAAKSPADIMMVLPSEESRAATAQTAQILRARGFKVEMYHAAKKVGDQIKYANKKAIPFVWFPPFEDGQPHEIKDMISGEQKEVDPQTWTPNKECKTCA